VTGQDGRVLSDQMLTAGECRDLAAAFRAHDYTVDAVVEMIGEPAHRAMGRNSTVPAVRAIGDRRDPLAVLTLLWPLQQLVARADLDAALPRLAGALVHAGLVAESGPQVLALVDIRPYASDDGAEGWVVSDLSPGLDTTAAPMRSDFVLGVSSASATLAQLTVRRPVQRALDLGTGCGVQSLHLARHAAQVVATDLNPRALTLARLTAALNGIEVDFRLGSLYEPVRDERFDLITSNPPYVMSPPSRGERLVYREGNGLGDALVEQVILGGTAQLAEGGVLQVVGNWAHLSGIDWRDRLTGWLQGTGCDAHVIQRETLDPSEYAELWLADAGLAGTPAYRDRYAEWLDYFAALDIEAVGMGWVTVHRAGHDEPRVICEDWPYAVEQPIGPAFAAELDAVARVRGLSDDQLLQHAWQLADDVVEETQGQPGLADPQHIVFRQQRGFRRARTVDTETAAILGACDGDLTLDQILGSVAELLGTDPSALRMRTLAALDELVIEGYLS
jgi:methylase of polypeptide subunit release factors